MPDMKISQKLSEKLGEGSRGQIDNLVDFEKRLNELMNSEALDEAMRSNIAEKFKSITELVVKVSSVTRQHISNDEKKLKIEKALNSVDIVSFSQSLNLEIENTEKVLQSKIKDIATKAKSDFEKTADGLVKTITDNMELVSEELKEARAEEAELKKGHYAGKSDKDKTEKLQDKKKEIREEKKEVIGKINKLDDEFTKIDAERAMVLDNYRSLGFFGVFKRMWQENKESDDKKGIFTIFKEAYLEAKLNEAKDKREELKEKAKDLYNLQCRVDAKIKGLEKEYGELAKQLRAVKKELAEQGEKSLKNARKAFDNAKEPKGVTRENLENVITEVSEFGHGMPEWEKSIYSKVHEFFADVKDNKVSRLEEKIEDDKQRVFDLSMDLMDAEEISFEKADEYQNSKKPLGREAHIDEKLARKIIRGVNKTQCYMADLRFKKKVKELAKAQKVQNSHTRRLERYKDSGMDR